MITRKEAEAIAKKHGIGVAPKDRPIYNEPPSIRFINRSTEFAMSGKEGSNSNQEPTIPVKTFKDGISEGIAKVERLIQEKLDASVAADKPTPKKRKEK